jgi:bifunctional UDP-N-acetylglucosamine pyrophosphorylase / glucosamine-1-phosphate N-acetyltransferase
LDIEMMNKKPNIKEILMRKGINLINPESIEIGEEIDPDRIAAEGVVIYSGSKIYGKRTLVLPGSIIGYETPATIENCYIGPNVKLAGGYFKDSVFLKNATFGSCAHVREGCVLEEEAGAAHSVGLKQTILFPYVTLGSLINFCDCFMAGGTGKKNHSEVGSSYIHFNFTPQQDKATPSMLGDVPRGVMLDQPPIFLGGQGGVVGPCRLGFGVTVAAGTICRADEIRPNRLIFGGEGKRGNISYTPGLYRNVKRIFINNLTYIGNIYALRQWYLFVRSLFISDDFSELLLEGLHNVIHIAIIERIKRLKEFVGKLEDLSCRQVGKTEDLLDSDLVRNNMELVKQWQIIEEKIRSLNDYIGNESSRNSFLAEIEKEIRKTGKDYIHVIKSLKPDFKNTGSRWLQDIVDRLIHESTAALPSFGTSA